MNIEVMEFKAIKENDSDLMGKNCAMSKIAGKECQME